MILNNDSHYLCKHYKGTLGFNAGIKAISSPVPQEHCLLGFSVVACPLPSLVLYF